MGDQRGYLIVTGGTGFVGRHVLAQLGRDAADRPWGEVKALVRSEEAAARVRALGATPIPGDLIDEGDGRWQDAVAGAAFVVHCAQPPSLGDYSTRVRMDERLIRALEPARTRRAVLVYGSSYYGETPGGARADETMSPRRPIGNGPIFEPCVEAARAAGERGLSWVAAFVGGVYGAGSWFLGMYAEAIRRGATILVRDPPPIWPYIHIDDCARAIEHLARVDDRKLAAEGREVIVVDDEPVPMVEFIERVAERMGEPARIERLAPDALRARVDAPTFMLNTDMAHSNERLRRLGFACRYPHVREGIASLERVG